MVCNAGSKSDHKNFSYGLGYPFNKDKKPQKQPPKPKKLSGNFCKIIKLKG